MPPRPAPAQGGGAANANAANNNPIAAAAVAATNRATSPLTPQRLAIYGLASVGAAIGVVARAFRERSNFYAATVWLARSNGCMLVLLNFAIFVTLMLGKICQAIFFGQLRTIEVEHLYERSWYAVTETLLAMTIFRDEFDSSFVVLFGTLLFLKVFHWLAFDRVELLEQSQTVSRLFHARMVSILWTLLCLDLFLVAFTIEVLILDKQRMGIMIMFASEFMILTATLGSTMAKYVINVIDMRSEEPWEGKSMYISAVDLITDFCKLTTYVVFFCLILTYYGLPLNIVRDVYVTARSFFGRIRDLLRYRAATRNMDTRFPNATHADLQRTDGTCIICREDMVAADGPPPGDDAQGLPEAAQPPRSHSGLNETPKKLVCGHIFHFHCLRSWLERQQSCPTCRRTVFESEPPAAAAGVAPAAAAAPQQQPQPPAMQPQPQPQHHPYNDNGGDHPTRQRLQQLFGTVLNNGNGADPNGQAPYGGQAARSPPSSWVPPPPSALPNPRVDLPVPGSAPATATAPTSMPLPGAAASSSSTSSAPTASTPPPTPPPTDPQDPRAAARLAALKRFEALSKGSGGAGGGALGLRSVTSPVSSSFAPTTTTSSTSTPTPTLTAPPNAPATPSPLSTSSVAEEDAEGGIPPAPTVASPEAATTPTPKTTPQDVRDQLHILQNAQQDLFRISTDLTRVLSFLEQSGSSGQATPVIPGGNVSASQTDGGGIGIALNGPSPTATSSPSSLSDDTIVLSGDAGGDDDGDGDNDSDNDGEASPSPTTTATATNVKGKAKEVDTASTDRSANGTTDAGDLDASADSNSSSSGVQDDSTAERGLPPVGE